MSDNWYLNIEEPIREIVKTLRDNGINTFCSCGHGMWVQCETYDPSDELKTIYNVMHEIGINKYRVILVDDVVEGFPYKHIEIQFPDSKGEYYFRFSDNEDYEQRKIDKTI